MADNNKFDEFSRMISGEYYDSSSAVHKHILSCHKILERYNALSTAEHDKRLGLLRQFMGHIGEGTIVVAPFHCDYGVNISIGQGCFINYDCVFLDSASILLGNHVFVGPQVGIYTPIHPIDATLRSLGREMANPVVIGDNVWIGGHATICPGVSIGDDAVIGAGSVVTSNIPPHNIAVGNPCHILRAITDTERETWRQREEDYQDWLKSN